MRRAGPAMARWGGAGRAPRSRGPRAPLPQRKSPAPGKRRGRCHGAAPFPSDTAGAGPRGGRDRRGRGSERWFSALFGWRAWKRRGKAPRPARVEAPTWRLRPPFHRGEPGSRSRRPHRPSRGVFIYAPDHTPIVRQPAATAALAPIASWPCPRRLFWQLQLLPEPKDGYRLLTPSTARRQPHQERAQQDRNFRRRFSFAMPHRYRQRGLLKAAEGSLRRVAL